MPRHIAITIAALTFVVIVAQFLLALLSPTIIESMGVTVNACIFGFLKMRYGLEYNEIIKELKEFVSL